MKKIALLIICLLLTNCATYISGNSRTVSLQPSDPDYEKQIRAQVVNKQMTQTVQMPGLVNLKGGSGKAQVIVKDKCFRETTTTIKQKPNYWFLANTLFTYAAPFSTTTDFVSGSMWTYDENVVVNVIENGVCRSANK